MRRFLRRMAKGIAVVALCVAAGVGLLFAALWLDHGRATTLPAPTGAFKVGRVTYDWVDGSRVNPYAPVVGTKQELFVWVWYPAVPTPHSRAADYLPPYWAEALRQHEGFVLSQLFSRDPGRIEGHSWSDAEVSPVEATYPVVIFRAGGGALSSDFTAMAEDLASHGYVVVSFDAPYRTVVTAFPDGRVAIRAAGATVGDAPGAGGAQVATQLMNAWVADVKFVLDRVGELNAKDPAGRFKGRLDVEKVGVAGHSLGGATTAQFCHDDARCKAGIDIDGMPFGSVIQDGLKQPFFFLMSDHSREAGPETTQVLGDIASIYGRTPQEKRWEMTILGANHFSFSDQMFTKSPMLVAAMRRIGLMGKLEKRRGIEIANSCVRTFFDVYLKGAPVEEMKRLPEMYPEMRDGVVMSGR